jgi:hypothetical protein
MQRLLQLLADQRSSSSPFLLMLGAALGHVKVKDVRLGPAGRAVRRARRLGCGLRPSTSSSRSRRWSDLRAHPVHLHGGRGLGDALLLLAAARVAHDARRRGRAGPGRRRWPVGLGRALGIEPGTVRGAYAGALTNTPALAAASARAGDPSLPTVGYSITYLGGVIVMLAVAGWALRGPVPTHAARRSPTSPCGSRSTSR